MTQGKIYYVQDGADFYLYDAPEYGDEHLLEVATAPIEVHDFDQESARRARHWFLNVYCEEWGINAVWMEEE